MRKLLFLGAAMLAASPLVAQPADYNDAPAYDTRAPDESVEDEAWDEEDYGRAEQDRLAPPLMDPGQIEVMAAAMDRLLGAVMNLPIGGIAAAVDPYNRGGIHPNATVRDMASRDDPYAEQRMRAGIRGATRGIGAMSQALARMMPVLERSFDQVGREIEAAMEEAELGPR